MESLIERVSCHDPMCTEVKIPRSHNYLAPNNDITQDELIRLVEALKRNPNVREIEFLNARRSTELFRGLDALFRVNTVIHCIGLPTGTNNEELMAIENSLRNNTTVTTLDLSACDIRGRQGGEIMGSWLSNGAITVVDLSGNRALGADGAMGLAQVLGNEHCALKKLDLSGCRIGNDGARELSTALANNKVVEELRISNNRITFIGFRHVVKMLATNLFLRVVDLAFNCLYRDITGHETVSDHLSRVFQRNTSLLEFSFDWYEGVSATELRGILEGLRNNTSLVSVGAWETRLLGEGSAALWDTWSKFVTSRNKMHPLLEGSGEEEPVGGHPVQPVPQSLLPYLLKWCSNRSRYGNESMEARASLIHHVLCARSNDIFEWVTTTTTTKRPALEG